MQLLFIEGHIMYILKLNVYLTTAIHDVILCYANLSFQMELHIYTDIYK